MEFYRFYKHLLNNWIVVTNLIRQTMDSIALKDLEDPSIMINIQKGITFRFETFAHFDYVRSCSHVNKYLLRENI